MENTPISWENNEAFTSGNAVKVYFFRRQGKLCLAEDSYFHLMSSMRRMRIPIPLSYTLEYFTEILNNTHKGVNGIFQLMVFPISTTSNNPKIEHWIHFHPIHEICDITQQIEIDILKEISVNTHFISNIRTYSAENIYASAYAKENDLDDVILLNPNKRMARTIHGNLLLLKENTLRVIKPSEGAYLSPLMESFITFVHKKQLAHLSEAEIAPFETQQAEEILLISDSIGIQSISKIRSKQFNNQKFSHFLQEWKLSMND